MRILTTSFILIAPWLFGLPTLAASLAHLDPYGGHKSKGFDLENPGFFRTHFEDGQWWLVTPENNAFLSFGLNHFHSNLWVKDYNKEHWEKEFGGNAWSPKWREAFYKHAREVVTASGANTMAYHNEDGILLERDPLLPYIRQYIPVKISLHLNAKAKDYVDVFSPNFEEICAKAAQEQVAPYVDDPMIIGFAMADIPVHTEGWAKPMQGRGIPTWAMALRNLPASSAGKQKYIEVMKSRYSKIKDFNQTYNTKFSSWTDLAKAQNWRERTDFENEKEIADNNAFNKLAMAKYYEVASKAFRAVNPNHLFLGDKLNGNMRQIEELELTIDVAKDYVDAILFQFYGKDGYQDHIQNRIATISKLPIINGDGGFGAFGDPKMPVPQYPQAKDQAERAQWMYEYAARAFKHPNFVGWHICGVIDSWQTAPHGTQKPGVMNPLGKFHTEVTGMLQSIGSNLYSFRGIATPTVSDNAPPRGFRSLFDGRTLNGWKPMPRLPVPRYPGAPFNIDPNSPRMQKVRQNTGKWTVVDGAIVGEQDPPASGVGAYLVSEETFGDFELTIDMKPDWRTDTGFLIRTLPGGSPGLQILCDFRPQGGIGGFYGNGLAGIHGMSFAIDAEVDENSVPIRVISADPNKGRPELREETRSLLKYAASVEDFLKVWKVGEFNTLKVRCEGRIPTVTTWVNGLKIAVIDLAEIEWENYDAEAIAEMTNGRGHISLEVHNNGRNDTQGQERWWPGAQVRWKNIYIRELD